MLPKVFVDAKVANVVFITAEDLVGAFADLHDDGSGVAREFRNVVERHANGIGDRLVLMEDEGGKKVVHLFFGDDDFVMIRSKLSRDAARGVELVEIFGVAEADGERVNRT